MKGSEIGLIVVGFLVIFALVAGGLYLYHTSRYNEYSEGNKMMKVKITNETPFTHTLVTGDATYISKPGETGSLEIRRHADISAVSRRQDGERVEFIHRLSNDNVNHLYITLDGFRTNLSSSPDAELVNASETDVLFIQVSQKGNEKYLVHSIPSESAIQNVYIPRRSVWEVAYPSEPDIPISSVKIGSPDVTRLVFDGLRLRAY